MKEMKIEDYKSCSVSGLPEDLIECQEPIKRSWTINEIISTHLYSAIETMDDAELGIYIRKTYNKKII